ncbi:MAG: hypothetical protein KF911_02880 [Pseudomonadales bacterium]|nr:hypothetical protein [Pseudomonadales bacterium]
MPQRTEMLHDEPSIRFPLYTRSNAAEVMGDPVSPLGWSLIWRGAFEPGSKAGYVALGGFEPHEFTESGEVYGIFGGYFYLNLSAMFILAERMVPGGAVRLAQAFDGGAGLPALSAEPWHTNAACSSRLAATQRRILAGDVPEDLHALHHESLALRAERPHLVSLRPAQLIERISAVLPYIERAGQHHVYVGQAGMIAMGHLSQLLSELGRTNDMAQLCAGIGDVESADIARQLWQISRLVRGGQASESVVKQHFDGFIFDHGCRATNEWDLISETFETAPDTAMKLIEAMSKQGDAADPALAQERNTRKRQELIAQIRASVRGERGDAVIAAADAVAAWFIARERSKNLCVRLVHEVRMCCETLAGTALASGALAQAKHLYMLHRDELERFATDPTVFTNILAERYRSFVATRDYEPPFIVYRQCPPPADWPLRAAAIPLERTEDAVLRGVACSPGRVTGTARIVLDPSESGLLEPGDILVTRRTNPSWTPLFLIAGGVVTEFGLFNSHASIVSRELGIPCVASVADVLDRVRDGEMVTIDGDTGEVHLH